MHSSLATQRAAKLKEKEKGLAARMSVQSSAHDNAIERALKNIPLAIVDFTSRLESEVQQMKDIGKDLHQLASIVATDGGHTTQTAGRTPASNSGRSRVRKGASPDCSRSALGERAISTSLAFGGVEDAHAAFVDVSKERIDFARVALLAVTSPPHPVTALLKHLDQDLLPMMETGQRRALQRFLGDSKKLVSRARTWEGAHVDKSASHVLVIPALRRIHRCCIRHRAMAGCRETSTDAAAATVPRSLSSR